MDGVAKKQKATIINTRACLNARDGGHGSLSGLLFVREAVLIAESEECVQRMDGVNEMGVLCGRRKLKVNMHKGNDVTGF